MNSAGASVSRPATPRRPTSAALAFCQLSLDVTQTIPVRPGHARQPPP
jgi:hypothetical protein